jgi:hypothetical protein
MNDDTEQLDEQELQRLENAVVNFLNTYYRDVHDVHTNTQGNNIYIVYLHSLNNIVEFVAQLYSEYGDDADDILYENGDTQLFDTMPYLNYDLGAKIMLRLGTVAWRK